MSFQIPLERGKIREFARATKSMHARFVDDTEPLIPPTFLTTAQFFWSNGEGSGELLDLDFQRVLHAQEEFIFHTAPPRAGQSLTVTSRLGDRYEKQGRKGGTLRFAVLVHEYLDETGKVIAEQRTTLVETSAVPTEKRS